MEKATEPKPDKAAGEGRGKRGDTKSKLTIHEERTVKADAPARSRFKGYTSFFVQDLVVRPHVTNFHCERWQTPDGKVVTASLPAGIDGHFGPELRRFVLALYHQGQTTVPRLVTLLRSLGIFISKRQVVHLLNAGKDEFLTEARDVLHAGLLSADWITVDDTGARHKVANGFRTQIGKS
jgi:Transposase IS66 family